MTVATHCASLTPHAATPCPALSSIAVQVQRSATQLTLHYRLQGEMPALSIPAPAPPEQRDHLWQHTCCEVFISAKGEAPYQEFNFSPATQWAAYGFTAYREGMRSLPMTPAIHCERSEHTLLLIATVPLASTWRHRPLQLGLSAVIESREGGLSYWALAHPGERPDFHHRAGHCLAIEAIA